MMQVYVPEGQFLMGSVPGDAEALDNEKPQRSVYLDAFWIDQLEVTNGMYALCVAAGECRLPEVDRSNSQDRYFNNPEYSHYPVIKVSWNDANTYCRWAGRRLPTEAEWEKAARGTDGRTYPWGNNAPTDDLLNFNKNAGDTTEVGSYPSKASPYGALNMAGNVSEFTADWYHDTFRAVRGGTWYDNVAYGVRAGDRGGDYPTAHHDYRGVRCAASR